MKKFLAILFSVLTVSGAAGCSRGRSASSQAAPASAGKGSKAPSGTLTVLLPDEPSKTDALLLALDDWAKDTGNSVKTTVIPADDQAAKWPTLSKSGQVPDLMKSSGIHQLYPDDFIDMQKSFDLSDFDENCTKLLATAYSSGKITGLPLDESITALYYNKDAFARAGLTAPLKNKDAWSWEQFYRNMKKLQSRAGIKYGFACDFSRARYDNFMYAFGGSLLKNENGKWLITAAQKPAVDALTFFAGMNRDGTMPKQIWAGGTTDNPANYFKSGTVGVLLSGSWQYQPFSKNIKSFHWGVMVSPGEKTQSCINGGAALAVPDKAKNKELAMSFLKWFYRKDNYQTFINNLKELSVRKDVRFTPEKDADKANWSVLDAEAQNVTPAFLTDESANWRQYLDDDYRTDLSRAVGGTMTPQQALNAFAKELSRKSGWEIAK